MDDREINALARGMVPFVRDCVSEAMRAATVPPELALEVAAAVRMLHESPAFAEATAGKAAKAPARVTRIERDGDGNLVPIYDEPQP